MSLVVSRVCGAYAYTPTAALLDWPAKLPAQFAALHRRLLPTHGADA